MKIIVLVKETFATDTNIILTSNGEIDNSSQKYILNPYDEHAVEEAVRIKEKFGGEVVLYTVGREEAVPNIKGALAFGADRAVIINSGIKDSGSISNLLGQTIVREEESFDLILAGWIAVDDNNAQVPARLGVILGVPCVNGVTEIRINGGENKLSCLREGENIKELVEVGLPAVVAVQKGINNPRYPTVQNILQAKKKKIKVIEQDILENHLTPQIYYRLPHRSKAGYLINGSEPEKAVAELVSRLQEAKVL